ncbi:MAG: flavodoxin domain-containing protein [Verrucomicrobiota bacterium]
MMTTIFFATQTGNAEACAEWLQKDLEGRNHPVRLRNLVDVTAEDLKSEEFAVFVVSTYGEGDPPDDAEEFHQSLEGLPKDSLTHLQYAVFALGDIDYTIFCGFGNSCDYLLSEAGANQLMEVEECNLDQAERLPAWAEAISAHLPTH